MGLNFRRWLLEKLGDGAERVSGAEIGADDLFGLSAEIHVRELAFWSCVNIIANAIGKCEFKTFVRHRETRGPEYYLWNVEPNANQNSSAFIHKWISQLYSRNEALVIEQNGQLLVADSFDRKPYALYDDVFSQVQVGDFTFNRTFMQSEVLYFRLSEKNMRLIANGLYAAYQKMIDYGMHSYQRSRGQKGVITIDTMAAGGSSWQKEYENLKNRDFKSFFDAENAVMPLFKGFRYDDLGSKTYSNEGTRDVRAMIDDVSDFTAKAFGIPPALLSGEVQGTSDALDQFLTFCVDPLADMLQEEINRKRNGYGGYSQGTYLQIDTRAIKHVDLLSVSTAIDKLISSGAYCINDIRKLTGDQVIDEPWAWQHFMTKNYATVAELLRALSEDTG